MEPTRNQVVCPECGKVRLETPPGTTILPTIGMARKAAGTAGKCSCGRAPHERPGAVVTGRGDLYEHHAEAKPT
jgi:hypothetical protein